MDSPQPKATLAAKPKAIRRFQSKHQTPPKDGAKSSRLRSAMILGMWGYVFFALINALSGNLLGTLCGSAVIVCAILPGYLWVTGKAKGYPVYPLLAFTFTYTFGLQMLLNRAVVLNASASGIIMATFAVCGFLLLGTTIWAPMVVRDRPSPDQLKMIVGRRSDITFLWLFVLAAIYQVMQTAGWSFLADEYTSVMRAIMGSFSTLAAFVLAYHLGEGKLTPFMKLAFLVILGLNIISSAASLLLVSALSLSLLSIVGYVIGSKKVPWRLILIVIPIFALLHYGKYSLREKYWIVEEDVRQPFSVKPWQYPSFFLEWARLAFDYTKHKSQKGVAENSSLLTRSSLLHIFLMVESRSPQYVPYLKGETYKILPTLLIPRFFLPNKPASHETTYLLNIHYGLQTRESTAQTTIGWGLFNESYANFGFYGVGLLAIVAACFCGLVTRFSMGCPLLSYRGLLAVLVMNFAFQSEYSSGVLVAALFQSWVALGFLTFLIMDTVQFRTLEGPTPPPSIQGKPRSQRRLRES